MRTINKSSVGHSIKILLFALEVMCVFILVKHLAIYLFITVASCVNKAFIFSYELDMKESSLL